MISHAALLEHAEELLSQGAATLLTFREIDEVRVRRAVSAAYYALFHALAEDGATQVANRNIGELHIRVQRAFQHSEMKEICALFASQNKNKRSAALEAMLGKEPDRRLRQVATACVELQQARHQADYDLAAFFWPEGARFVALAKKALETWLEIRRGPDATVFLTALLLGERLYRHA